MLLSILSRISFLYTKLKPNKKPQVVFKRWKIFKGDRVMVRTGPDKGNIGKIVKVLRKQNKIVVRGINLRYRSLRTGDGAKKQMVKRPSPIHISNVGLYDSLAKKPVRIRIGFHPETGERIRVSKKTGRVIPLPNRSYLKREKRGKFRKLGVKDTESKLVQKITYFGEDFDKIKREFEAFIADKEAREKHLVFKE